MVLNYFRNYSGKPSSAALTQAARRKWFIAAREQRQKREQMEERAEEAFVDVASAAIVATETQIESFNATLDAYDEATVRALMENQKALDAIQIEIDDMLSRAYQLEDGRRVFKTEDGATVYDEHGAQLDGTVIHPDSIPDNAPRWESFRNKLEDRDRLLQERQDTLDYQERLDEAREHANSGDMTQDEMADLEAELEEDIPPAIVRQLPDYDPARNTSLTSDFTTHAREVTLSAAMPKQTPATPGLGH